MTLPPEQPERLKKVLGPFSVFAIATGTTLSAGFFLLPGLAFASAGPAVILSYLIAGLLLVPAMLCIVELGTAMPRAGGAYFYLDRSLGPLAGTIGGIGTWLALTLKTSFALVGMGYYLRILFPGAPPTIIAVSLAVVFGIMNYWGSGKTGKLQIILVIGLLAILSWFIGWGTVSVENFNNFDGFFDKGSRGILSTAGLVFISYVGVTKVASIAEEVKDPERNLPRGVFTALTCSIAVYVFGIAVIVLHVPADILTNDYTVVATTAETFAGRAGVIVVSIAAILAFSSVANGGILSSSRYPLAMGRDKLVPSFFAKLDTRGVPVRSILFTVAAIILFILVLDPLKIAKLASGFQLLMFALLCLAVIVMRESRIPSYDPGYRCPFYPWLPIVGVIGPFILIAEMGWLPTVFSIGLVILGIFWFRFYCKKRVTRVGAIRHVLRRMGGVQDARLDRELRTILKEKGLRDHDPFDESVVGAAVIEARPGEDFESIVKAASHVLASRLSSDPETLTKAIMEGTRTGMTPVAGGVALPHLRFPDLEAPLLVLARCDGIQIPVGDVFGHLATFDDTYAIFFLVSPEEDPGQHLRILAQLASRVDQDGFIDEWRSARGEQQLKEILLRDDRYLSILIARGLPSRDLIDRPVRNIDLPEECLIAILRRGEENYVPQGNSVLREGDQLTILGSKQALDELRARYEVVPAPSPAKDSD
jgi:basic amino acid/polyamine antiporter, APA family